MLFLGLSGITVSLYGIYKLFTELEDRLASTEAELCKQYNRSEDQLSDYSSDNSEQNEDDWSWSSEWSLENSTDSSSYDEEDDGLLGNDSRVHVTVTPEDLEAWGVADRISGICQKIRENLEDSCLADLDKIFQDPRYQRDPIGFYQLLSDRRGVIQHLKIPDDLALLALHKLHETPGYLDRVYQDHNRLHHTLIKELKRRHLRQTLLGLTNVFLNQWQ